jgi:hypothetical protein
VHSAFLAAEIFNEVLAMFLTIRKSSEQLLLATPLALLPHVFVKPGGSSIGDFRYF